MNLTDNERNVIANNRLQKFPAFLEITLQQKQMLIDVFSLGMLEMEILDTEERIMEREIELNNIRANE